MVDELVRDLEVPGSHGAAGLCRELFGPGRRDGRFQRAQLLRGEVGVLQDGGETILTDTSQGSAQVIDPAFVSLTQKITYPIGSQLAYGANTMSILGPDGRLWVLDTSSQLSFSPTKTPPAASLAHTLASCKP